jgi:GNAT superfamily N-acetyltransferase
MPHSWRRRFLLLTAPAGLRECNGDIPIAGSRQAVGCPQIGALVLVTREAAVTSTHVGSRAVNTMTMQAVSRDDQPRAIATLVSAFIADPVERWLYPEPSAYLTNFPAFVAAFGGAAFENQTVWSLDEFAAVAMWLPPGREVDGEAIVAVLSESVSPDKHADTFAVLEQMDAAHPKDPHWYLPWLGVDRALQGTGLGADLLRQCLVRVDAEHSPAFLETPNPRTLPFYERHGFRVTSVSQAGACPPMISMLRPAR